MMQTNPRKICANGIVLTACFGLTSCAAILDFPGSAWNTTKSLTSKAGRSVASLLRPGSSPENHYEAYEASRALTSRRRSLVIPDKNQSGLLPLPTGYTRHRLPKRQVRNVWHDRATPSKLRPASSPDRAFIMAENEPVITELSWVKIGGPSHVKDWEVCEQSAGSFAIPYQTSYRLKPEFIACMRSKNYVPESEAQRNLRRRS